jgi:hypothetical protein
VAELTHPRMMTPGMKPMSTSNRVQSYYGMRYFDGSHGWHNGKTQVGCSKRPSNKAAASEEARRTLRYVEPLSEARMKFGKRRVLARRGLGG